jgi:hypothetical protein
MANDLRLLDPKEVRLRADTFGRLWLREGDGEEQGPVQSFRALPLTKPSRYISLQTDDGEEVGLISDMDELDSDSRAALERDLELYYLKAKVQSIQQVETKNGLISFDLMTDLGERRIHVRDRQQIRIIAGGSVILTDIHGGKYEVPPLDQLDEKSRRLIEMEL